MFSYLNRLSKTFTEPHYTYTFLIRKCCGDKLGLFFLFVSGNPTLPGITNPIQFNSIQYLYFLQVGDIANIQYTIYIVTTGMCIYIVTSLFHIDE